MRCFIAINLDEQIKQQLQLAQSHFHDRGAIGKVSWTRPEQMHLTIKFLGDVPDETIAKVAALLADCAGQVEPFEFPVQGLGVFPPTGRQLRIVWVGVTPPDELIRLNDLCQKAFVALGYPAEKRRFAPHLTIGRVRHTNDPDGFRRVIADHQDFNAGVQYADSVVLYSSDLRPGGAVYTPLTTVKLAAKRES